MPASYTRSKRHVNKKKIENKTRTNLTSKNLSARVGSVEKKITSFRCPVDYLEEVEELCRKNRMDRSTFITMAIRQLVNSMAEQGAVAPMTPVELPPPAEQPRHAAVERK